MPYALRVEDEVIEKLIIFYGDSSWIYRIEPFLVRIPHGDSLISANRGSMGVERMEDHRTRDLFGSIWRTDTKGAEHLEEPVLKEPNLEGYTFPEPRLSSVD